MKLIIRGLCSHGESGTPEAKGLILPGEQNPDDQSFASFLRHRNDLSSFRCERQFTPYPPSSPTASSFFAFNTVILALNINIISGLLVN